MGLTVGLPRPLDEAGLGEVGSGEAGPVGVGCAGVGLGEPGRVGAEGPGRGRRLVAVPRALVWAAANLWSYVNRVGVPPDVLGAWLPGQVLSCIGVLWHPARVAQQVQRLAAEVQSADSR